MMRSLAFAMIVAAIPFVALAGETVNYTVNGEAFEDYKAKAAGQSKGAGSGYSRLGRPDRVRA